MKQFISVLLLLAALVFTFFFGRRTAEPQVTETIKRDTVVMWDTVRVDRPVYITERIIEKTLVPVPDTDTLMVHDTTYVSLPRTQREYADSTYHAWVSGYQPQLDSIRVYNRTQIHTVTIRETARPKHWGIGVQVGMGITTADNKVITAPYVGVGVSYNLLSF